MNKAVAKIRFCVRKDLHCILHKDVGESFPLGAVSSLHSDRGQSIRSRARRDPQVRETQVHLCCAFTNVCAKGLWGAAKVHRKLEYQHLQQGSCVNRGSCTTVGLGWHGAGIELSRIQYRKVFKKLYLYFNILKYLLLWFIYCITNTGPEDAVRWFFIN